MSASLTADMTVDLNADLMPPRPAIDCDTLAMHRNRGILAGDFIKPDPALTRQECRKYLLTELERWLTGRICGHAKEIEAFYPDVADLTASVEAGTWPAARLYTVLHLLERSNTLVLPADYYERFHFAAEWCIDVCADHLKMPSAEAVDSATAAALGFVTTDKLVGGHVIESFWDHSPFDALRKAAPLIWEGHLRPSESAAMLSLMPDWQAAALRAAAHSEADSEAEAEAEAEAPRSIDAMIDAFPLSVSKLLTSDFTVRLPGWAIATAFSVGALYVWSVAMALSMAKHC
jgi:hypothetical protein